MNKLDEIKCNKNYQQLLQALKLQGTDDHLRNHGFIYHKGGWLLSPAYDINPVTPAHGLHLNISDNDNSLNYDLVLEVIDFFQLSEARAVEIKNKVLASVRNWETVATNIGLNRAEQQTMRPAFNV